MMGALSAPSAQATGPTSALAGDIKRHDCGEELCEVAPLNSLDGLAPFLEVPGRVSPTPPARLMGPMVWQ
jgi:hypothetical protein